MSSWLKSLSVRMGVLSKTALSEPVPWKDTQSKAQSLCNRCLFREAQLRSGDLDAMNACLVPYHWRLGSCISSALTLAFKCLAPQPPDSSLTWKFNSQKGFLLDGRVLSVPGMAYVYYLFPALASLKLEAVDLLRPQSLVP